MTRAGGMIDRTGGEGAAREFQLEARHLVLLILVVVVLCVASFMFGRWVERQNAGLGVAAGGGATKPGDPNIEDMGDVSKDLTFFDTLEGNQPAPLKQPAGVGARPSPSTTTSSVGATPAAHATPPSTPPAGSPTSAASSTGSSRRSVNDAVMIQVFASKDRAAADAIRKRLRSKGYTALLVPDHGTYKVRVGPYADREEAVRAAAVLREQENLTTWIP